MARRTTGSRFNLGEPIDSDLADFCTAHYDASATSVIRTALESFIEDRLKAEPELKKRFDRARKERLASLLE